MKLLWCILFILWCFSTANIEQHSQEEAIHMMFDRFDSNTDGEVDENEIKEFVSSVGGSSFDELDEQKKGMSHMWSSLMKFNDKKSKDKALDYKEFNDFAQSVLKTDLVALDVLDWMENSLMLPQYVEIFRTHNITGLDFFYLLGDNGDYLKNMMGIENPIHRQRIINGMLITCSGLTNVPSPPVKPSCVKSSRTCGSIVLNWKPSEVKDNVPPHRYKVEIRPDDSEDSWVTVYEGPAKATTVKGLEDSLRYDIRVYAYNIAGRSGPSAMYENCRCSESCPKEEVIEPVSFFWYIFIILWWLWSNASSFVWLGASMIGGYALWRRLVWAAEDAPNSITAAIVLKINIRLRIFEQQCYRFLRRTWPNTFGNGESNVPNGNRNIPFSTSSPSLNHSSTSPLTSRTMGSSSRSMPVQNGAHQIDGVNSHNSQSPQINPNANAEGRCYLCNHKFSSLKRRPHCCKVCFRRFCSKCGYTKGCWLVCPVDGNCTCGLCYKSSPTLDKLPSPSVLHSSTSNSPLPPKAHSASLTPSNRFKLNKCNVVADLPAVMSAGVSLKKKTGKEHNYQNRYVWLERSPLPRSGAYSPPLSRNHHRIPIDNVSNSSKTLPSSITTTETIISHRRNRSGDNIETTFMGDDIEDEFVIKRSKSNGITNKRDLFRRIQSEAHLSTTKYIYRFHWCKPANFSKSINKSKSIILTPNHRITVGPPKKLPRNRLMKANGAFEDMDGCCLSLINKAGKPKDNIDLKFPSEEERDFWSFHITKLLKSVFNLSADSERCLSPSVSAMGTPDSVYLSEDSVDLASDC